MHFMADKITETDPKEAAKQVIPLLDEISPSMCMAKWLWSSIHLTTGQTNSCFLPPLHKIDVKDITDNPKGLHNTPQKKEQRAMMLKGEKPNLDRPGKHLAPIDLEKTRQDLSNQLDGMTIDDEDLNGYLMYPKVFLDYMGRHRAYGPVRTLPTKTFFYGMEPGEEISVEIDPGKIMEIRLQAVGETLDDGEVKVFFELNGQPRVIRVPNRLVKSQTAAKPKAELGNPNHLGAPMPGVVASIGVHVGQEVHEGDLLLTIEAMKMETGLHAERDAKIKAIHVTPSAQIDAKDLLIEFE